MRIKVLTIFPEMLRPMLETSILKRAIDAASMPSHRNAAYELGVEVSQP